MISTISLLLTCGLTLNNAVGTSIQSSSIAPTIYSDNIYSPPVINMNSDYGDSYEDNGRFNNATMLSPDDSYMLNSYHTRLSATIDTRAEIVDVDMYVFTLFTNSNINLSVSAENCNYSYDLVLMRFDAIKEGTEISQDFSNVYEDSSTTQKKDLCCSNLRGGNYFIYIRGKQPADSNITIKYTLDLTVSRNNDYPSSVSIGDLRFNKNLLGAIWKTDFVPANDISISEVNNEYIYYYYESLGKRDYVLEKLASISEGKPIHFATLYIWDNLLRYALSGTIETISTILRETVSNQERQNAKIEVVNDIVDGLCVVLRYLGKEVKHPIVKLVDYEALISTKILNLYLKTLIQDIDIENVLLFSNYLGCLRGVLYESENYVSPDAIQDEKPNNVVQIPLYYSLRKEKTSTIATEQYIISYRATLEKYQKEENFICMSSSIPTTQDESYYCGGRVYGINSGFKDFNSLPDCSSFPDIEPEIKDIEFIGKNFELYDGEYCWYKFTAPETRTYYICSSGGKDIIVDLFNSPVKGYSNQGLIKSYQGGVIAKPANEALEKNYGCYFSRGLSENQTVYFRIRNGDYNSCAGGSIYIGTEPFSFAEELKHEHYYERFVWKDKRTHTAYCECMQSIIQGHVVSLGSSICLQCGGRADTGFIIQLSSNNYITENGSYILPNGIIVLNERDIEPYLMGILKFKDNNQLIA